MRSRLLGLALFAALAASSACSIDATAPSTLAVPGDVAASKGQDGHQGGDGAGSPATYSVRIDPTQPNVLHFGRHELTIPANAVCAAAAWNAGVGIFDEKCRTETHPVTIVAMVSTDSRGNPRIDFKPEKRFSPRHNVVLSMYVGRDAIQSMSSWRIFYCPGAGFASCIDESLLDPSLTAHADVERGFVYRRIKHFSGYWYAD